MRAALVMLVAISGSARADGPAASGLPSALDRFGLWAADRAEVEETLGVGLRLDGGYLRKPLNFYGVSPVDDHFDFRGGLQLGVYKKLLGVGISAPAGDVRAYFKATMLQTKLVSLGLVLAAIFPTGDGREYRSDDSYGGEPKLIVDVRWKWLSFVVNVGARLHFPYTASFPVHPMLTPNRKLEIGPELTYALALAFVVHPRVTLALEAAGSEAFTPEAFGGKQRTSALLLSMFVQPSPRVSLFVGIGRSLAPDAARTDVVRLLLGVSWGSAGLPPVAAAAARGSELPVFDSRADRDHDGVPDLSDGCPDEAEDRDGYQDGDGCPENDNDGDGITDDKDRCPTQPETENGVDDEDGCPDTVGVAVDAQPFLAPPAMFCAANASLPRDRATLNALNRLADSLFAHPEVKRLRIEGHAWQERHAQELSQRRADEVRSYLLERGLDPKRIQSVGYGEARPADPHNTPRNRRIEFIVLE